ncbi:hypothetical protein PMIN06_007809 [Paraphaeosphaeria minitans]
MQTAPRTKEEKRLFTLDYMTRLTPGAETDHPPNKASNDLPRERSRKEKKQAETMGTLETASTLHTHTHTLSLSLSLSLLPQSQTSRIDNDIKVPRRLHLHLHLRTPLLPLLRAAATAAPTPPAHRPLRTRTRQARTHLLDGLKRRLQPRRHSTSTAASTAAPTSAPTPAPAPFALPPALNGRRTRTRRGREALGLCTRSGALGQGGALMLPGVAYGEDVRSANSRMTWEPRRDS